MMLPSGNDAAALLSQLFGYFFTKERKKQINKVDFYNEEAMSESVSSPSAYNELFVQVMNEKCRVMGVMSTYFFNPHGNDGLIE